MAFKSIFFPLASYPVATIDAAIERAVRFARQQGAHLSAAAFEMDVPLPVGVYADAYSLGEIIAAEYQRGASNAHRLIADFRAVGRRESISHEAVLEKCVPADVETRAVELAHLTDLSLIALKKDSVGQRDIAEALLFGAGRPVLLFPEAASEDLPDAFDRVAVAWDNKGPAARAVGDAIPFLCKAGTVQLLTIENEGKAAAQPKSDLVQSCEALGRHLARHGVAASLVNLDAKGEASGQVLLDYAFRNGIDLLVMGAYGHARLKEVVLGGTTDSLLREPPGYVLMSR